MSKHKYKYVYVRQRLKGVLVRREMLPVLIYIE